MGTLHVRFSFECMLCSKEIQFLISLSLTIERKLNKLPQFYLIHFFSSPRRTANNDLEEREKVLQDFSALSGERNVESMLLVEKGLRELALLKVFVISLCLQLCLYHHYSHFLSLS